jgi:hypothetical protein
MPMMSVWRHDGRRATPTGLTSPMLVSALAASGGDAHDECMRIWARPGMFGQ